MATLDQDDLDAIEALIAAYGAAKPGDKMDWIDSPNGSAVTSILSAGIASQQTLNEFKKDMQQYSRRDQVGVGSWTDLTVVSSSGMDNVSFTLKYLNKTEGDGTLGAWDYVNGFVKDAGWTDPCSYDSVLYLSSISGTCDEGSTIVIRGSVTNGHSDGGAGTFTITFPKLDGVTSGDFIPCADGSIKNWQGGKMTQPVVSADVTKIAGDSTSATNLRQSTNTIYVGSVTGAGTSTSLIDSGLTQAAQNHWYGRIILFTSGSLKYQATDILAFDPVTDQLSFTELTGAPGLGDAYVIV